MNIDKAVPLGLIINELISNALKHAFPEGKEGTVRVGLKQLNKDQLELVVQDNGIGLQKQLDFNKVESLGLLLVKNLTEQIDGTITVTRDKGTIFKVRFSV